ncbi:MAG TPA: hypothetical protein VIX89_04020 [Bryobacteraceae bacterium]
MPLASETLVCSKCGAAIPFEDWNREHAFCTVCRAPHSAYVFPALFSKIDRAAGAAAIVAEGEASCYYHPRKRAAVPCDQCGRFLCALCQVDFLGQNWCPGCIEAHRQKGQLSNLDASRPLHDNMALALATLPAVLIWPTIVTAPMSLYLAARDWRKPSSVLPRTKVRFYLAVLFAVVEIAGWIWLAAFLIHLLTTRR